jgi:hypothetical protein
MACETGFINPCVYLVIWPHLLEQADLGEVSKEVFYVGGDRFRGNVKVLKHPGDQIVRRATFLEQMPKLAADFVKGVDRFHVANAGADRDDNGFARDLSADSRRITDEERRF